MARPRSRQNTGRSAKQTATAADRFEFPIKTKAGVIETVGEAFAYIDALPKNTQQRPEWQLAIRELHHAVTKDRAWLFFARMGINRAMAGQSARKPEITPRVKKDDAWREQRKARKMKEAAN